MPLDTSIYGMIQPQRQQQGPLDMAGQAMQIRHLLDSGELNAMQRQQLKAAMDEDAAVKAAFAGMQPGQTIADLLPQLMKASPKTGVSMQAAHTKQQADAAQLEKANLEVRALQAKNLRDMAAQVQDDAGLAVLREAATKAYGPQYAAQIPPTVADPAFAQWRQKAIMTADEFLARVAPKPPPGHTVQDDGKLSPADPNYVAGRAAIARAGAPTVVVGTEKKYGEQFASQIAQQDAGMLEAARKAPDLATRANQVLETLGSGKVITGAGADIRLQIGKVLNLGGASDAEVIANTEVLATDLARNTLDAIKASGLGAGNGFSNADRDFLEKAVGGKITLEGATIKRLAELAHKAAEQTTKRWGARVKEIPADALRGTGITGDVPQVAPLFKAPAAGPAAPPFTPEQIDAELRRRRVVR